MADPTSPRAADLSLAQQISLLSGQDFWHSQGLPDAGVSAMTLTDGPHGVRLQEGESDHLGLNSSVPATCFPPAVTLASSWDEELVTDVGRAIGREASALGVDVVLGPGLNIKRHPLGGRNFEYFSEDPVVAGRMAAAMVRGIQDEGVGACPKHFAVNNQEGHRFVVDAVVDDRTVRELYLAGFEHAVKQASPWTVMAAYNSVNGTSMTVNRTLLTDVLRGEWGFDGLVVSDWTGTGERRHALRAGMDLAMPGGSGIDDGVLRDAVDEGRLAAADVERSARRVLRLAERTHGPGAGGGPDRPLGADPLRLAPEVAREHDALARRTAAAGAVLLTNDETLPLTGDPSVALIGPFGDDPRYQGAGSSRINPTRVTTVRDALGERGTRFTFDDGTDVEESARRAAAADVAVLMVGLPGEYESEGFDREHLALPPEHVRLIDAVCAAQPATVVVLSNGAPVAVPWRDRPAAILEAYLGGQASGGAVVDVLFGDVEPGGRLAESFPETLADVPADGWFPGQPHQVEYREGLFVGYRHHVSGGRPAAFPFGHGLGYTTFDLADAALDADRVTAGDDVTVSVTVTNTGGRVGSEVVQIYRHDRSGVVLRPRRELVAFTRVSLDAGESRRVELRVSGRSFAYWDTATGDWQVPEGPMALELGRSSVDVLATLELHIESGVTTSTMPADGPQIAETDEVFADRLGRPVPAPRPVRPFSRESTIGEIAGTPLGALLRRVMLRASGIAGDPDTDPATSLMAKRSFDEIPLRAAAHFAAGKVSWRMVDGIIAVLNRQPDPRSRP